MVVVLLLVCGVCRSAGLCWLSVAVQISHGDARMKNKGGFRLEHCCLPVW